MRTNLLLMLTVIIFALIVNGSALKASPEIANIRHIPGEITWIDLKIGELQLEQDHLPFTGEVTKYRISEHETRVSSPTDKKFLSVNDLQPGQHVIVDVINGLESRIVGQITADPTRESEFQQAYGEIQSIDGNQGKLVLVIRHAAGEIEERNNSLFLFEPSSVVVMQSPSKQPVTLMLKPGDVVKVDYVVMDGKRHARYITLYAPQIISTTTTTTTTVSH